MTGDDAGQLIYYVIFAALVGSGLLLSRRLGWSKALRFALIWAAIVAVILVLYALRDLAAPLSSRIVSDLRPDRGAATAQGRVYTARNDGHFYIASKVNGRDVTFLVDTGASDVVLTHADARAAGLDPARLNYSATASTANGIVRIARVRLDSLDVGPFALGAHTVSVASEDALDISLLGMTALRAFGSVELSGDRLILKP